MVDIKDIKRKAIENMYVGKCTIAEYQTIKNPTTKKIEQEIIDVVKDQPCKLSFKTTTSTNQTEIANAVNQTVKLFVAPEINVKAGSKITVTQNGRTTEYKNSGEPAIYSSHQEIILELFKGWA